MMGRCSHAFKQQPELGQIRPKKKLTVTDRETQGTDVRNDKSKEKFLNDALHINEQFLNIVASSELNIEAFNIMLNLHSYT